ncbi:MAG: 50S ribosomal protein L10 [Candidatus Micrarchaeota archaeon]
MTKMKGSRRSQAKKIRPALVRKQAQVEKIAQAIKGAKTVALIDVRALPDRLLQAARKQLRGKAVFLMAKNSVLHRSLEMSPKGKGLADRIRVPSVLVLTDLTAYGLFRHFKLTRAKVAAKPGQIADVDIIVKEGETDLPPGPALSELKGAGINAQIKAGKIVVAKDSVVAKAGTKIPDAVCKALQKLNVLPFMAGLTMVAAEEEGRLFEAQILDIDEETLQSDLACSIGLAYNMSIHCAYPTEDNRVQLLSGALAQARALASESGAYSPAYMESLLASAIRLQNALEGKAGASTEAKSS